MLQMSYDDPYSVIDLAPRLMSRRNDPKITSSLDEIRKMRDKTLKTMLKCLKTLNCVGWPSSKELRVWRRAQVKSARCIINVAGPYMLTQGELMCLEITCFSVEMGRPIEIRNRNQPKKDSKSLQNLGKNHEIPSKLMDRRPIKALNQDRLLHQHGRPLLRYQRRDPLVSPYHALEPLRPAQQGASARNESFEGFFSMDC